MNVLILFFSISSIRTDLLGSVHILCFVDSWEISPGVGTVRNKKLLFLFYLLSYQMDTSPLISTLMPGKIAALLQRLSSTLTKGIKEERCEEKFGELVGEHQLN